MKKKTILLTGAILIGSLVSFEAFTFTSGAPAGRNGSPMSGGVSCAVSGCHSGGPAKTNQIISISSDIPATGFMANTDYNFTVTLDDGGSPTSKVGLEISIEDGSSHVGVLTPGAGTKAAGSFLTHTSTGTVKTGSTKAFDFVWNSGSADNGSKVWIAANFSNANGGFSGDVIVLDTLRLQKESGITLNEIEVKPLQLFPNPATNSVQIQGVDPSAKSIEIFSLEGKLIRTFSRDFKSTNELWVLELNEIENGIYFVLAEGSNLGQATRLVVAK